MAISFEYDEEYYNYSAAEQVLPVIIEMFTPSSILDVGCGTGTWLKVARDLGVKEIMGMDGAIESKNNLKIPASAFLEKDLRKPFELGRRFDLVMCLEVAEHLPEQNAATLIRSLCKHGDNILFSAAIPDQGGQGHINEQWPDYWQSLFSEYSFKGYDILRPQFWNNEKVDLWYRQNMILFSRNDFTNKFSLPDFGLLPLVHPALLKCKLEEIANLEQTMNVIEHRDPGVRKAFKMLRKALMEKIKS